MLTDIQTRELNRDNTLLNFFKDNTTAYESYDPFKAEVDEFILNVGTFIDLSKDKDTNGKGETDTKAGLKQKAANLWGTICDKTWAYAFKTKNDVLQNQTKFHESDILKFKDGDIIGFANNLNTNVFTSELMSNAVFIPYNVTAGDVGAALDVSKIFNDSIGKAKVVDSSVSTANKDINEVITIIRQNITMFDSLISNFATSNPDFVSGYEKNKKIDNIGVRHTGIQGIITINKVPTNAGKVSIIGTDKTSATDLKGQYAIIKVRPSDYQVKAEVPDMPAKIVIHHFNRGEINELNFEF